MQPINFEHSRAAYDADFALYVAASVSLLGWLVTAGPPALSITLCAYAAAGLAAWTVVEYLLHRFVLHGLRPFSDWHAEHHRRPAALISAPTLLSASLLLGFVFLPAWGLVGLWPAVALSFGVLTGYLFYAVTHHLTHHLRGSRNAWLQRRKRHHALHHGSLCRPGYYGVTSAFWDHVFGTHRRPATPDAKGLVRRQGLSPRSEGSARMPRTPVRRDAPSPVATLVRTADHLREMLSRVGVAPGRHRRSMDLEPSFDQVDSTRLGERELHRSAFMRDR